MRSKDFRRVYDQGSRFTGPFFAAFCVRELDASGPRILYGPMLPGKFAGTAGAQAAYRSLYDDAQKITNHPTQTAIFTDGDFGIVMARIDHTSLGADGAKKSTVLRQTDCLRREHGQWYPVYEMVSHVIDKTTGKPAAR